MMNREIAFRPSSQVKSSQNGTESLLCVCKMMFIYLAALHLINLNDLRSRRQFLFMHKAKETIKVRDVSNCVVVV